MLKICISGPGFKTIHTEHPPDPKCAHKYVLLSNEFDNSEENNTLFNCSFYLFTIYKGI